ncbi:MAG: amidase [Acidobacteriota bacterium]|nr:amidase [Acidobacteriota bacterium]
MSNEKTNRREFMQASTTGATALLLLTGKMKIEAQTRVPRFELEEATIADLQSRMRRGEMSAKDITEKYLERIRDVDQSGASLKSVIETNPDAERIAEQLDRERKSGRVRSPLHGIPVLIKDNIDTSDRMKTTAGSLALVDAPTPQQDAFLVQKLREAGAVIIGKTNLSEWANFRSSNSSSGWSARGGQTRNPYILDRNPCGSSSGSGTAISANLAAVAVGTETDGSIICPSSNTGIVGIKPTLGLISRAGVIPISHSQDTAGPMTRTVTDAAILLGAMTGAHALDSATRGQKAQKDYTQFLRRDGLRGARIGVMRQYFGKNGKVDKVLETALDAMKAEGATLIDVKFPTFDKFGDAEFEVLLYEFKTDLNKYLAERNSPYRTLADLIKFNEDNKEREMPFFGQDIFISAQKKGGLNDRAYRLALQKSKTMTREQGIDAIMNQNKLDAIFAPSNAPIWATDLVNGDCFGAYIGSSSWAAVAGYPSITVPAGFVQNLPVGVSFFGRPWTENLLLKHAYSFEQTTKTRRAPQFLATASHQ